MTRHPHRRPRRNPLITLTAVMAALIVPTIAIPSLWPAATTAVHLGIAVLAPITAEILRQLHDRTPTHERPGRPPSPEGPGFLLQTHPGGPPFH